MTYICVSKLTIIGSDKGLSPGRRQAIIWTNAGILLIRPFGTNFSGILIEICTFSFKKIHLKMSSAKWHPFCLSLSVLNLFISNLFNRTKLLHSHHCLLHYHLCNWHIGNHSHICQLAMGWWSPYSVRQGTYKPDTKVYFWLSICGMSNVASEGTQGEKNQLKYF